MTSVSRKLDGNRLMLLLSLFWFLFSFPDRTTTGVVALTDPRSGTSKSKAAASITPGSVFHNHIHSNKKCFDSGTGDGADTDADDADGGGKGIVSLKNRFFAIRHGQSQANVERIIASDPHIATVKYGLSSKGKQQAQQAGKELVKDFLEARQRSSASYSSCRSDHLDDSQQQQREEEEEPSAHKHEQGGILIVTSDFTRAIETAEELARAIVDHNAKVPSAKDKIPIFGKKEPGTDRLSVVYDLPKDDQEAFRKYVLEVDAGLRERWFGTLDGKPDKHYQDVWKEDVVDPYHTCFEVESVWSVLSRAREVVHYWETLANEFFAESSDSTSTGSKEKRPIMWIIFVAHGDVLQILQTSFLTPEMDPKDHRSLEHLETATLRPLQQ